jgi:hypothetical protein
MTPLNLPFSKILKLVGFFSAAWILATGCSTSRLPEILQPKSGDGPSFEKRCRHLFPEDNIQMVHSLEVRLPGKNATSVIGITNIYPGERALESVIMTIEGLVLFHARYKPGEKEVLKSVKPFTSEQFSSGLLKDIQLIFLLPGGSLIGYGQTLENYSICRYQDQKGDLLDILLQPGGNWFIKQYNKRKQLIRSVTAGRIDVTSNDLPARYPKTMILESHGFLGYSLIMNLLRAEHIDK